MAIVSVLKDAEALAAAAAERVTALIEASIAARHGANICLTGGQTPRRLYQLLADRSCPWRARIDWTRINVFWGDERHVPPDHDDSNFGMAHRALLAHVPVPPAQVHRMRGELADATEAAREYEMILRGAGLPPPPRSGRKATRLAVLAGRSAEADRPRRTAEAHSAKAGHGPPDSLFDVMLLGLGEDAHLASIFPGSPLLGTPLTELGAGFSRLGGHLVAAVWVEHLHAWRITLTPPALLDARAIAMLVSGGNKADAVRAALDRPEDVSRWPAQLLRAAGDRVEWFIDSAAARLRGAPPS